MVDASKQLWAFEVTTYPDGSTFVGKPFKMGKKGVIKKKQKKTLEMGDIEESIEL